MVDPELLSKINERRVLEFFQSSGPTSRAAIARACELSAPTVSKAVAALIRHGMLEECGTVVSVFGRPGRLLQIAAQTANVFGVVIDAGNCWVGSAQIDGELSESNERTFPTPRTYSELLSLIEEQITLISGAAGAVSPAHHSAGAIPKNGKQTPSRVRVSGSRYRGVGVSVPGLLNSRLGQTVMSPNLRFLNGEQVASDLSKKLRLPCVTLQESHALCVGERMYGAARGLDNFAMLDVSTGLGLGVVSGGRPLTGNSGLAGELGHITVDARGVLCGCGNSGCLETVATDSAFARRVSETLGRPVQISESIALLQSGQLQGSEAIECTIESLGIAIAAVINIFNPATLFVHGRFLGADPLIFARVLEEAKKRSLGVSFADCRILQAKGNKRLGAIAGIIQNLADAWAPALSDFHPSMRGRRASVEKTLLKES